MGSSNLNIPRDMIDDAEEFLRKTINENLYIDVAVVLGTGFAGLVESFNVIEEIPYSGIPYFPRPTVEGHPGVIFVGEHESRMVALFQGRCHLYEEPALERMLMPVAVMKRLGCSALFLTNAAGGINPDMRTGDLMIISDHINLTGVNPLAGKHDASKGPRFLDASEIYDHRLLETAIQISKQKNIPVREGVYIGVKGPTYETPAEIQAFRRLGGDVIGMSTVIEALYARHLGMNVFGLSCISNVPSKTAQVSHLSVQETVSKSLSGARIILLELIASLPHF